MGKSEETNIKSRTYYFIDDMINITNFDPNLLKTDKKWYKNIDIYYIGYMTMKDSDYVKMNSVNPLYLIIEKIIFVSLAPILVMVPGDCCFYV